MAVLAVLMSMRGGNPSLPWPSRGRGRQRRAHPGRQRALPGAQLPAPSSPERQRSCTMYVGRREEIEEERKRERKKRRRGEREERDRRVGYLCVHGKELSRLFKLVQLLFRIKISPILIN